MKRFIHLMLVVVCFVFLKFHNQSNTEEARKDKIVENSDQHGNKRPANRLIKEKSPYLLQHAHNPVDWYPWGDEAFETAKKENKPIFLSIGYSTCHWCHVMEKESFEDPDVARLMNDAFVCIKVDREERPDIDSIYMTVCQLMTGRGGWPLNIIMTPDKKPFFAGTYIPKESRFGQLGMKELIPHIETMWTTQRNRLENVGAELTSALKEIPVDVSGAEPGEDALNQAYKELAPAFDEQHGGFGAAPKFPSPHNLLFLLRYWKRSGDDKALSMVEKTLRSMRLGGVYDHVGFGFHRYSTDAEWFLPHFEKMLYDQAMLAIAYTEAYQATCKEEYKQTASEILVYIVRDMTDPEGGFYSAEDADSDGEEGKFYLWTEQEIRHVLTREEAELVITLFNVEKEGNFADEATRTKTERNILHLTDPLPEIAEKLNVQPENLRRRFENAREKLFAFRENRVHPAKDDKILTDWNGLMIVAMAKAARAFGEKKFAVAARKAADFILTEMRNTNGQLLHRFRDGEAAIPGFLDDYAFLIWGLIELYETTFEVKYLEAANELNKIMISLFWDDAAGAFYFTADDAEKILVRKKDFVDGAYPSGNSVAMLNLVRLGRMIASPEYEEKAARLNRAFSPLISRAPMACTQQLVALDFAIGPSFEVVIVGNRKADDTRAMLTALRGKFIPNKVVLFRPAAEESPAIASIAEFTAALSSQKGKATAYVCRNYQCNLPTTDIHKMLELLTGSR